MDCFHLSIVARGSVPFRGLAQACTVMETTGSRTFEAHHERFLTVLASPSVVTFRDEAGREGRVAVVSGLLGFSENSCSVVVELEASTRN